MNQRTIVAGVFFIIVAIFFLLAAWSMRSFGAPEQSAMDDYIIENTQSETGANNGVTSVVFDYRGFDTLGEATILFTAVAAVVMILRREDHE
jgi:multisubunit Na+/H+ antiporter MnhB subunit